jgi:hypothetical protein
MNFWAMCERVLIASMNKGQFPIACVFIIILVWLIRLPEENLYGLFQELFDKIYNYYIWGWIISIIVTFTSVFGLKYLRRVHTEEIQRLSEEKTKLQEKFLGEKILKSSN